MSNSVGNGSPNIQQVQQNMQNVQQEVQEQKEFNYQLSKFNAVMPEFKKGENSDVISIFSRQKTNEDLKETKSGSAKTTKDAEGKNIFEALLGFDDPTDGEVLNLINETFDMDIDAKAFSDVWDSIEVISEKLYNEKDKALKELANTINAFNEPPVDYKPTQVVVNAYDDLTYTRSFVA